MSSGHIAVDVVHSGTADLVVAVLRHSDHSGLGKQNSMQSFLTCPPLLTHRLQRGLFSRFGDLCVQPVG